jgi:hypothetical protein
LLYLTCGRLQPRPQTEERKRAWLVASSNILAFSGLVLELRTLVPNNQYGVVQLNFITAPVKVRPLTRCRGAYIDD